jgi:hypothetical protein
MIGRIEMEQLKNLKDNEDVKGKGANIFNYMFKKNKVTRIKFENNSKNACIFPLSQKGKIRRAGV